MADQLDRIVKLAESGRIRVNLLPFDRSPHPLLEGLVTLMWFEDQPPMVAEIQGSMDVVLSEAPARPRTGEKIGP
ncbi:Scr1 family TA system antitoxin-like transcriptional regulator [Streptomyces sp. NBC_00525]|uniref:Scr1 family TA system antitoxin-like transcriptional regulator n=1 Tax=Streptomyces sp. NBC_00525 TaxID=2903660 RepID=UPI002E807C79|nr:Scr1 family TA system antitoxin-like transcriptional regulator [Streptomyces sp. NBC_00525]